MTNNDSITEVVEAALADQPVDQVVADLERRGLACARMRTPEEFDLHPQLEARDRWRDVGSPGGPLRALLPPVVAQGWAYSMGDVPGLGEHSTALREEFGGAVLPDAAAGEPDPTP